MRRSSELLALASILTLISLPAGAHEATGRTITVEGQAEIRVVPDEVILTLGVDRVAGGREAGPASAKARTNEPYLVACSSQYASRTSRTGTDSARMIITPLISFCILSSRSVYPFGRTREDYAALRLTPKSPSEKSITIGPLACDETDGTRSPVDRKLTPMSARN